MQDEPVVDSEEESDSDSGDEQTEDEIRELVLSDSDA